MTKAERLFWDARAIAKDEKLWNNYVVGTYEGLKSFTQAIQKAEREIKFDSNIRNADDAGLLDDCFNTYLDRNGEKDTIIEILGRM